MATFKPQQAEKSQPTTEDTRDSSRSRYAQLVMAAISVIIIGAVAGLYLMQAPVPQELLGFAGVVLGYYFRSAGDVDTADNVASARRSAVS